MAVTALLAGSPSVSSFAPPHITHRTPTQHQDGAISTRPSVTVPPRTPSLNAAVPDLDVVALVAGQENYGLAVVAVGEALWSFLQAPSFDHAKVLVPATISAAILGLVSGPMITMGDASQVATGLGIATVVSVVLGATMLHACWLPFRLLPRKLPF